MLLPSPLSQWPLLRTIRIFAEFRELFQYRFSVVRGITFAILFKILHMSLELIFPEELSAGTVCILTAKWVNWPVLFELTTSIADIVLCKAALVKVEYALC